MASRDVSCRSWVTIKSTNRLGIYSLFGIAFSQPEVLLKCSGPSEEPLLGSGQLQQPFLQGYEERSLRNKDRQRFADGRTSPSVFTTPLHSKSREVTKFSHDPLLPPATMGTPYRVVLDLQTSVYRQCEVKTALKKVTHDRSSHLWLVTASPGSWDQHSGASSLACFYNYCCILGVWWSLFATFPDDFQQSQWGKPDSLNSWEKGS